jgi:hypothetical protein
LDSSAIASPGLARPARAERLASLGRLLPIAAPVTLLGLALIAWWKALIQPDTWVGLVSGREIAHHFLPSIERLTLIAQGRRWVDQQWLGQLTLYGIERAGGVGVVVAVGIASLLTAFALAAFSAQERGASPPALLFWLIAGFLAGPSAGLVRTQSLAIPLFGLILWLILRDPDLRDRASLWTLPVLCLWANIHGSVVLGSALVAAHGLQALLRTGRRWLPAALLALAPLTVLASPYAMSLPRYYHTMLLAPPYGRHIVEWQRTTPSTAPLFFGVAGICALLICVRGKRLRPIDAIVLALTFASALSAVRLTLWFGVAALAIMPPLTSGKTTRSSEFDRPAAGLAAAALIAVSVLGLGWVSQRNYESSSSVVTALRTQPPTARVAAVYNLADWVLWAAPNLRGRVELDARAELLTKNEWQYVDSFSPAVSRHYTLLVVDRSALAARIIKASPRWRRIVSGDGVILLQRG